MNAASTLPLAIEPPPHYAAEVAACMINEQYQPCLNDMGTQFIAQQEPLAELQKQVAEAHERRTTLEVGFSEVVRSWGTTPSVKNLRPSSRPLGVTKSSSILSVRLSRQNSPHPPPRVAVPATPSPLPRASTVHAPQAVEQKTPGIRIERERPLAVARQIALPTTPQVPGAFVSAIPPPVPAKPSGNVGPPGFTRRSEALAPTRVCSPDCRVVAKGSDISYVHRVPCLKSDHEAINIWSRPRNDAPQQKSKQNRCGYCESVRHTRHSDCPDFLRDYVVNTRAASQQPPPPPSNPLLERMDEDVLGEDGFGGYDSPRGGPSGKAGGRRGNLPPRGGNAQGGGDPGDSDSSSDGDSDSSLPDPRKFLGRRMSHWNDARKEKYDRRCHELAEYLRKQRKGKKSAHRPKKPEKSGVDPFKGDSTDTQCFIQDCEIKLDYFRESLLKDWDKVSLVIPLLQGPAKKWY